jgi:hypothetical protein
MAITFVTADLVAFEIEFTKESQELANARHGIRVTPSFGDFGSLAVAGG